MFNTTHEASLQCVHITSTDRHRLVVSHDLCCKPASRLSHMPVMSWNFKGLQHFESGSDLPQKCWNANL